MVGGEPGGNSGLGEVSAGEVQPTADNNVKEIKARITLSINHRFLSTALLLLPHTLIILPLVNFLTTVGLKHTFSLVYCWVVGKLLKPSINKMQVFTKSFHSLQKFKKKYFGSSLLPLYIYNCMRSAKPDKIIRKYLFAVP